MLGKKWDSSVSSLPKIRNAMYNRTHETKPQANHNRSSRRRYMRVITTCHGLRLNERTPVPNSNRFGTFYFLAI